LWGKNFKSVSEGGTQTGEEDQRMLKEYFGGLSKSGYQGILTQYFDSTSRVAPEILFPTPWIDESSPTEVEGGAIEKEVAKGIEANKANGWVVEPNAQFVVATAPGSTYSASFGGNFCAYHSVTTGGAIYGFDPYQGDPRFAGGCLSEDVEHNGVHMTSKVASHEYSETATDPNVGSGWRSRAGAEIGDLCNFNGDKELGSLPNEPLGDHAWAQGEYDDNLGGCAYNDPSPPHVFAVSESPSATGPTEATMRATVNAEGEANTSYFFEYGPTTKYGTRVPTEAEGNIPLEANRTNLAVSKKLANLQKETLYHYRVVAVHGTGTTNGEGTTHGEDQSFATSRWAMGTIPVPSLEATFGGGFACFTGTLPGFVESQRGACGGVSCPSRESCTAVGTFPWFTAEKPMVDTWNGKQWSFAELPFPEGPTDQKFGSPEGVTIDSAGHVWVADAERDHIDELSSTGEILGQFGGEGTTGGNFKEPVGVAVDSHEHVWVTDSGNNRVQELSTKSGAFIATFGWGVNEGKGELETCTEAAKCRAGLTGSEAGELKRPTGIAVAPNGNKWVADTENNRVERFSAEGTTKATLLSISGSSGTGGGQYSGPAGLVTDTHENLWVVDSHNNRVQELSKSGAFLQTFGWGVKDGKKELETCTSSEICKAGLEGEGNGQFNGPTGPTGIALENEDVWVVDRSNDRVEEFKPEAGKRIKYLVSYGLYGLRPSRFNGPWGIAIGGGFHYIGDIGRKSVDKWKAPASEGSPATFSTSFGGESLSVAVTGVSCASVSSCMAVGYEENTGLLRVPVAVSWNGTEWSIARIGPPSGATEAGFLGVSCFAANECMAVGFSDTSPGTKTPFAALWKGGSNWSVQSLPTLSSEVRNAMLEGVSCTSASFCMAVGFSEKSNGVKSPLVDNLSGSKWTPEKAQTPTEEGNTGTLSGVSCASSGACTAVGYYWTSCCQNEKLRSLAERWEGTEKGWVVQPTANAGPNEELVGVSCPSTQQCTAVGDAERNGRYVAQVQVWNGLEWRPQITSEGEQPSELHAVSCAVESMCAAVGTNGWSSAGRSNTGNFQPLALTTVAVQPPAVSAGSAKHLTGANVTLAGSVQPNEWATTYHFEYGTSTSYGHTAPVPDASLKSATSAEEVQQTVSLAGLAPPPGGTWHYRLVATNAGGTTFGEDHTFSVPPPGVSTGAAKHVTGTTTTLTGSVQPNEWLTSYRFEYGTSTSYGSTVPVAGASLKSETAAEEVQQTLALTPNTTYHYRLVATNPGGTSFGEDRTLTTGAAPAPSFASSFGSQGTEKGQLSLPQGDAVDAKGNVWVADYNNNRVEEFSPAGESLSQFGIQGSGEGQLNHPHSVAFASSGDLWVTDGTNNRLEEFEPNGKYVAQFSSQGGEPVGVAIAPNGDIWVSVFTSARVDEYTPSGKHIREVGSNGADGIAVDPSGDVWVTALNSDVVQEFTEEGKELRRIGGTGSGNGQFSQPTGISVDTAGNVWVSDALNDRVQEFNANGEYVVQFGTLGSGAGQLSYPEGVAVSGGLAYVVDRENHRVERWSVGTPIFVSSFGSQGTERGQLSLPQGDAVDRSGNVWVADYNNNRVEEFSPAGQSLSQFGIEGSGEGQLHHPHSVAIASSGDLWVTDGANNRLEEFEPNGKYVAQFSSQGGEPVGVAIAPNGDIWVSVFAFSRVDEYKPNGEHVREIGGINGADGVAVDSTGDVWVTALDGDVVQEFTEEGKELRKIGSAGSGNGQFNQPTGISVDAAGNVWVSDAINGRVQEFNANGEYLAQFGTPGSGAGQLNYPEGVAVSGGLAYVVDRGNFRVEKWAAME
jgi:streptogramin lyase